MREPRTIEDICGPEGEYVEDVKGNVYCSLGMTKKVSCLHHSGLYRQLEKDHNDFYFCINPLFNPRGHALLKKYEV